MSGRRGIAAIAVCLGLGQPVGAMTLEQAVRVAVTSSPTISKATAEARASAQDLGALEREYLPTVSLTAQGGAERVDDPVGLTPEDNDETKFARRIDLNAELVLFDGYRRSNLVYQGAADLDGSLFRMLDASETLALNATEAYIDVVRHRQLVDAARRNVARHKEIGAQVRAQVEGGRLPASSALQVSDRIDAAELAELEVRQALRDANARFERIVGQPPGTDMAIPRPTQLPGTEDDLVQAAMRNSFRLRAAQTAIDRARFEKTIVESNRLPRVSLNAGAMYGEDLEGSRGEESDLYIGFRLNWELYAGGRSPESRALAERVVQAQAERDEALREVRALAQRSWNTFQSATERAILLERQLRANRSLVRQYTDEFEASTRSLLDVLEAERALFRVQFQKISSDASFAFSQFRLLATQSVLAGYFGVKPTGIALEPGFQSQALQSPTAVFDTAIEPLQ
ncbi:TolC family protein [Tropicimonas sp. S265A]|uniref:TolC family protein n=1 Tax=Tropicimonas sp. S265A TaxID=3415134 RepID=UPI003C7ED141